MTCIKIDERHFLFSITTLYSRDIAEFLFSLSIRSSLCIYLFSNNRSTSKSRFLNKILALGINFLNKGAIFPDNWFVDFRAY